MATPRVISLTERALLYAPVLDWVSPPNCEKLRITGVANSAIESLLQAQTNPYSNSLKTSYWHWGTKPIKAFARFLHTASVTCLISPIGILYHGAYTAKHLSSYAIHAYSNDANDPADWEKTKQYAKAFFTEVTSFLLGATITWMSVGGVFCALNQLGLSTLFFGVCRASLSDRIWTVFGATLIALGGAWLFGSFTHESALPKFIAWEDERVGMYLSLSLRNNLGLVNEEGGLLPFSSADKLEYTVEDAGFQRRSYQFKGAVFENLKLFCFNAELELLDKVREANKLLLEARKLPLRFTYPFDGTVVAKCLEKEFPLPTTSTASSLALTSQGTGGDIHSVIRDLRRLQSKVELFKEIHRTAQQVTLEDSVWMMFVKAMARQQTNISIPRIHCFVTRSFYQEQFNLKVESPLASGVDLTLFTGSSLNPDVTSEPTDNHYDQFKYRVQTAKWRQERGDLLPPAFWYLGLAENCTYAQYRNALKNFALLHPDKQRERAQEAGELFKVFMTVKGVLDEHFAKKK